MEGDPDKMEKQMIVIDECVYSQAFERRLKKALPKYDVLYLGSGIPDSEIEKFVMANTNAVLVTADSEFDAHFDWKRSLYISSDDSIRDRINLIKSWLNR